MKNQLTMKALLSALIVVFFSFSASATHYLGGSVSVTDGATPNEKCFTLVAYWNTNSGVTPNNPQVGDVGAISTIDGDQEFIFGDGSPILTFDWTVTAVDNANDRFETTASFCHTYNDCGNVTAFMGECCTVSDLSNNNDYSYALMISFDPCNLNNSPVSAVPPFVLAEECDVESGTGISIPVLFSDPDGDVVSCSLVGGGALPNECYEFDFIDETAGPGEGIGDLTAPAGASIDPNTCEINFQQNNVAVGDLFNVIVCGTDNEMCACYQFNIQIVECCISDSPVFTAPADQSTITVCPGEQADFDVTVTDADSPINNLTASGVPVGASFTPNGNNTSASFIWTPTAADVGNTNVITFTAEDDCGQTNISVIVNVEAGNAPVFDAITAPDPVCEGEPVSFDVTASDPDNDITGITLTSTEGGSFDGTTYTWTPAADGSYTVEFEVTDACGNTAVTSTTVVVEAGTPPTLSGTAPAAQCPGIEVSFDVTAADVDGDLTGVTLTSTEGGAFDGTTYTWTPTMGGSYNVTFEATDDCGNVTPLTVAVAVLDGGTPVFGGPTPADGSVINVCSGLNADFGVEVGDGTANPINVVESGVPAGATFAGAAGNPATGSFTWATTDADVGSYTITFDAANQCASASTSVTINVVGGEGPTFDATAPVNGSTVESCLDEVLQFTVSASDDALTNETVTVSQTGLPASASFDPATGIVNWTPVDGDEGMYPVTFSATDGCTSVSLDIILDIIDCNVPPTPEIMSMDPCVCGNPLNIMENVADDPSDILLPVAFFWETITIQSDNASNPLETGLSWSIVSVTGAVDENQTAYAAGDVPVASTGAGVAGQQDNGDGTYTIYVYHPVGAGYSIELTTTDSEGNVYLSGVLSNSCDQCIAIPTLSEWGLITLCLMLMAYGSVAIGAVSVAFAGSKNIPLPFGRQLILPFDKAVFRKSMIITLLLVLAGWILSIALTGTVLMSDIVGPFIAGPVFAYLMHLLWMMEKNRKQ